MLLATFGRMCRSAMRQRGCPATRASATIVARLDRQHLAAHQTRITRPVGNRHDDDDVADAGAERGDEAERHQDEGQRQERVDDAHHEAVDRAADIARQQADDDADSPGDGDGEEGDQQRRRGRRRSAARRCRARAGRRPSRWLTSPPSAQKGGFIETRKLWSLGSCGTIHGAKIAATRKIAAMAVGITGMPASRSRRRPGRRVLWQARASQRLGRWSWTDLGRGVHQYRIRGSSQLYSRSTSEVDQQEQDRRSIRTAACTTG